MSVQIKDFFGFEKMVTPLLIKIIFWIGIIATACAALVYLVAAFAVLGNGYMSFPARLGTFFGMLLGLSIGTVLGVLFWRVWCELLIIAFNIYDVLKDIRDRQRAA